MVVEGAEPGDEGDPVACYLRRNARRHDAVIADAHQIPRTEPAGIRINDAHRLIGFVVEHEQTIALGVQDSRPHGQCYHLPLSW